MSVIMDWFNIWAQRYDQWRKQKMDEIQNPDYQRKREIVEEGEQAEKPPREIQREILTDELAHGGEDVLKQVTRIAVIIIVGLIGIIALLQIMPPVPNLQPPFRRRR